MEKEPNPWKVEKWKRFNLYIVSELNFEKLNNL